MSFARIDLSQVHELADDLRKAGDTIDPKVRAIMAAGGHRVAEAIKSEIRLLGLIETDFMERSTSVDVDGLGFEAGSEAPYAIYQDQGTSELPANNFHAKGFDRELPGIIDDLADAGSRIL